VSLTPITGASLRASYLAALIPLPRVITSPGQYITRCGETVTITDTSQYHWAHGYYSTPRHIAERWHRSGRLYAGQLSDNDIIKAAQ
jgi:hypothetical protein